MTSEVQRQVDSFRPSPHSRASFSGAENNTSQSPFAHESDNNTEINNPQAESETAKKKRPQQKTMKGRPRKRKTTVLAIGSSRTTTDANSTALVTITGEKDSNNGLLDTTENLVTDATQNEVDEQTQQSQLLLLSIPPIIPENTTGKPPLSAFCTAFPNPKKSRTRRKGAHHADAAVPAPAAAIPEQELPLPNSTQHAGPQVQIVNGEIVLQESSIVFQGSGATQAHEGNEAMTVVEEEAQLAVVGATYTSFATGRRARTNVQQWTVNETSLFYEALRQVGLDFGTMEAYFENAEDPSIRKRTRRQLKHKYKAESNKNPSLVEKALRPSSRMDIDLSVFQLTKEAVNELQNEKEKQSQCENNIVEETTDDVENPVDENHDSDGSSSRHQDLPSVAKDNNPVHNDNFWPDTSNPMDEEAEEDGIIVDDPILFDSQEHEDEGPPAIAFVHGVVAKQTKKKPKFRSRKLTKQK